MKIILPRTNPEGGEAALHTQGLSYANAYDATLAKGSG